MVQEKLIIICGPTCVGKTRVGVELARLFGGEIISADSQQVYKFFDIGTAKPSEEDRKTVPHHLIDVVDPDKSFDVAQYVKLADEAIAGIVARGHKPFLVGGTGLYIKALCHGLAKAPGRDEPYRLELSVLKKEHGTPYLFWMLQEKDPKAAARVKINDTTRITRALEVLHLTGRSILEFQHGFSEHRYTTLKIGLKMDRAELYKRINCRVDQMMENGLVEEAQMLAKKYGPDCQALRAVGYREIVRWCDGMNHRTIAPSHHRTIELSNQIKRNTRRYAKRQLTWFNADKEIKWFSPEEFGKIKKVVEIFLSQ